MQYPAADQAKAAMADLMSIAKWKAPHASTGAWQAGLDEIDRFYRNDISQSNTGLQPTEGHDGSSNEYNAEQAGFNRSQSLLGAAHEILPPSALTRMSYPVEFELTTKQSGASVLQQDQPAEPLPQPASPVPDPASKSHRPHAATSPDPGYNTLLSKLTQESQSTDVEPPPEPLQTQHQPTCKVAAFNLLQPPTQQAKDLPLSHSPSARPLSKSAHRESTTPLLPKPNALQPLQQTPQWNVVNHVTARPKWTLEPPPPPGLQPAFEGKGKDGGFEADGVGSRVSTPLRERSETGGTRVGGVWVSGDGSSEGCGELGEEPSVGAEGRGVHGADEERRLGELRVDVTTRDQVADVTACRKGKASDGTGAEREDGTRDSDSNENASSTITHTCAPDAVGANEENEHEERNEHINAPRRDDNTTTLLNAPGQTIPATDPHFNLNAVTMNSPRWSPANSRTSSNARDEIASLKRGRQNASSSSNSSPADTASSPPPPTKKKKKKTSREDQSPSVSEPGEEALEQGPPEEPHPEDRDTDHAHPPIPADQEGQVNTADFSPANPDLPPEQFPSSSFSPASSPSSSKKQGEEEKEKGKGKGKGKEREKMGEKANEEESTKKRKRSPRPTMSKRELSNLEGTTVEGKLRRRGPQEGRREQSQPQSQSQQRGQKSKERKRQNEGQKEGQEDGKGKGKAEGAARRKRQRRA